MALKGLLLSTQANGSHAVIISREKYSSSANIAQHLRNVVVKKITCEPSITATNISLGKFGN
jgi:hypothetical protein